MICKIKEIKMLRREIFKKAKRYKVRYSIDANKYYIADSKGNRVSPLFDRIYADGLVKGRCTTYVAGNYNNNYKITYKAFSALTGGFYEIFPPDAKLVPNLCGYIHSGIPVYVCRKNGKFAIFAEGEQLTSYRKKFDVLYGNYTNVVLKREGKELVLIVRDYETGLINELVYLCANRHDVNLKMSAKHVFGMKY